MQPNLYFYVFLLAHLMYDAMLYRMQIFNGFRKTKNLNYDSYIFSLHLFLFTLLQFEIAFCFYPFFSQG